MQYLSYKVEEARFDPSTPERRALRTHLNKLAMALHAVEWNDSGDGAENESELIRACLSQGAVLEDTIAQAKIAVANLSAELARAMKENQNA
jgi:hypothetical protein